MTDLMHVNKERLWQSVEALARVGATPAGGVSRLALSPEDRQGRDQVQAWLEELGLETRVDWAGNLIAIRPGREETPPVLIGSHLDTVLQGGRFDGAAGVLAGLEVLRSLEEAHVHHRHPLGLAVFTNEEGARYPTDMMGSQAFIGALSREQMHAIRGQDGTSVGEEMQRNGLAGTFPCGFIQPQAYLEMHIEQGPLLEAGGIPIGVVEAITGISWWQVRLRGAANHSGTTPMEGRQDAALAAARIIAALPELAASLPGTRATCGRLHLSPGIINVIPGEAVFTVDLRHDGAETLQAAGQHLQTLVAQTAGRSQVQAEIHQLVHVEPQRCDPHVVAEIEKTSRALGYACRRMVSGAGHDAQILAKICPAAMIFVPSRGGVSHSPQEYSSPEDLEAGATVLLHTALHLAGG